MSWRRGALMRSIEPSRDVQVLLRGLDEAVKGNVEYAKRVLTNFRNGSRAQFCEQVICSSPCHIESGSTVRFTQIVMSGQTLTGVRVGYSEESTERMVRVLAGEDTYPLMVSVSLGNYLLMSDRVPAPELTGVIFNAHPGEQLEVTVENRDKAKRLGVGSFLGCYHVHVEPT